MDRTTKQSYQNAYYKRHITNPIFKAKHMENTKQWRKKNKQKIRAYKLRTIEKRRYQERNRYQINHLNSDFIKKRRIKSQKYYNSNRKKILAKSKLRRNTIAGLFMALRGRARYRKILWNIPMQEFVSWYEKKEKKCHYCGLSMNNYSLIKDSMLSKAQRMTIDRIDNTKGYIIENIALSCMRCNHIKSDFFSEQEMMDIGTKYVARHWIRGLKGDT